jgi:hypothetical protein
VVTPETVVHWHRAGFRLYWKLISKVRRPIGRQPTSKEVQELIFRMVVENPTWVIDVISINAPSDPNQGAVATSKNGLFKASLRQHSLIVEKIGDI